MYIILFLVVIFQIVNVKKRQIGNSFVSDPTTVATATGGKTILARIALIIVAKAQSLILFDPEPFARINGGGNGMTRFTGEDCWCVYLISPEKSQNIRQKTMFGLPQFVLPHERRSKIEYFT